MPAMARSLLHLALCSRPSSSFTNLSPRPPHRSLSRRSFLCRRPPFPASAKEGRLPSSRAPPRCTLPWRQFHCAVASASAAGAGASPVVVAEDDKYGKKQVVSLTPQLYDYILANVRENPILRELREETATMRGSQMQVSPDQAQLLSMIVQILGAERCIELGVYTGYSSLAIALSLPQSGHLVACERDANCLEVAKKYYERAGVSHKVITCFDFAFVDAEKRMYDQYFELLLQLVRVGGVIVFDNVLWHGKVADPLVNDPKTTSIRSFNSKIFEDKRINISMVPIGDGMTICRKISNS